MTLSELNEHLLRGGSIECSSPKQRNSMAKFIQDELGFQIGPGTLDYMTQCPNGTDYSFVELFNKSGRKVTSFCVHAKGETVPFERVSHLISSTNLRLDDRTDEEFLKAFTELLRWEVRGNDI